MSRPSLEDIDAEMIETEHLMNYGMKRHKRLQSLRAYEVNRILEKNKTLRKGRLPKISDKDITYGKT